MVSSTLLSSENKVLNAFSLKGITEMAIDRAIKEWEEKTCVKFIPCTKQKQITWNFFAVKGEFV